MIVIQSSGRRGFLYQSKKSSACQISNIGYFHKDDRIALAACKQKRGAKNAKSEAEKWSCSRSLDLASAASKLVAGEDPAPYLSLTSSRMQDGGHWACCIIFTSTYVYKLELFSMSGYLPLSVRGNNGGG